jgi:hypothetical protein
LDLFTPLEYLKIDISNSYGNDKLEWHDRIAWFDQNEHQLMNLMFSAKEPALFFAGVQAWHDVKRGDPIGYPISLDATSSGLQLLSVLTGDRPAAEICNVVDVGKRMDAYTAVYDHMLAKVGGASQIQRDDTKSAIMKAFYGSTAEPKKIFGKGQLLTAFHESMDELTPACWELNKAFLAIWDPKALTNDWVLPDNFHVHVKVIDTITEVVNFEGAPYEVTRKVNAPMEGGRSLSANVIHSVDGMVVREMTRRCGYDPKKVAKIYQWLDEGKKGTFSFFGDDEMVVKLWDHYQASGYLSARIIDHLQPENMGHVDPQVIRDLLDTLPEKPFTILTVHDCFRCLPKYANDLRAQYVLQLHLLAKSDLLSYLLSQLLKRHIPVQKYDNTLAADVLTSNYALS